MPVNKKYFEEHINFIKDHYVDKDMSMSEVIIVFNNRFPTLKLDVVKCKAILRKYQIKKEIAHKKIFSDEIIARIKELESDHTDRQIAEILSKELNQPINNFSITRTRMLHNWKRAQYHRNNKSLKGESQLRPSGAIRLDRNDLMIKYNGDWVALRRLLYEYYTGEKLERNEYVFHKNNNKFDFRKENLCKLPYDVFTRNVNKVIKYNNSKIVDSVIAIGEAELSIDNLKE